MTKDNDQPGNDPKAAQREAKELKPNHDTEEERDDILGREFEAENEHDLEPRERPHEPLTDPDDNAKVDRVVPDSVASGSVASGSVASGSVASGPVVSARAGSSPTTTSATRSSPTVSKASPRPVVVRQPEARSYLMSPAALRNLFIASSVAGVALIVVILTLASSGNYARYTPADETQYQRTLQEATQTITAMGVNKDSTAHIPIDEAIIAVAAQGLGPVNTALAAPPEGASEGSGETRADPNQAAQGADQAPRQAAQPEAPAAAGQSEAQADQQQTGQEQANQQQTDQPTQAAAVVDTAAGQAVYEANCASCHQVTGAGVPGAFPKLAGHVPTLYNADRSYLVNLLLYGLQGEIQVLGEPYNGVMPAWQQLSDDDIAATLNYVSTAWDNEGALENFQPFDAGEIATARDAALSSDEVYALRQKLGLSGDE